MKKKWILIVTWILLIYLVKHFDYLSFDLDTVKEFVTENKNWACFLFIGLWIIRLIFLIPGTTLMILGGVCFNPMVAFLLSTVGIVLSETLVYIVSRRSNKVKTYLENRHPELSGLLETYNYKFLALGVICPIAPADVICFLSASVGINYFTYILTITVASTPLRIVYSFMGLSLTESTAGLVLVVGSLLIVFAASTKIWSNLKRKKKIELQQYSG